jgi:hypothetical protein
MFMMLKSKMEDRKIRFDMGAIIVVYSFCVLIAVLL